jgi:protein ImuA
MDGIRNCIIQDLQKRILGLESLKPAAGIEMAFDWGPIKNSFPNRCFPLGAIHEIISEDANDMAAGSGFICSILSALMKSKGVIFWIAPGRKIFPPALAFFDINPERIFFIDVKKEKEILWTIEESLKCDWLNAVVGEIGGISFTASRRLQLAVEQSRVTGFLLRHFHSQPTTTACVSRWKITHLSSETEDGLPGVGFPRWNVSLEKIRNGKPGQWQLEWSPGRFRHISPLHDFMQEEKRRKTG